MSILALIEFLEPSEARKAFHALAYKKYKHLPLYLEWAPDNSFAVPASETAGKSEMAAKQSRHSERVEEETTMEKPEETDSNVRSNKEDDEPPEADTTLFVKNINFGTTEEQLADVSNLL